MWVLESSRASESAWYVGAVQRVPTKVHNRFQSLTNEEEEEEEFEECREIPSLESSSSSEDES
eukprot:3956783-Karenia_brevis.AAC.1